MVFAGTSTDPTCLSKLAETNSMSIPQAAETHFVLLDELPFGWDFQVDVNTAVGYGVLLSVAMTAFVAIGGN